MIAVAIAVGRDHGEAARTTARASPSSPIRAPSTWTMRRRRQLVDASTPIYYITGTIHSPETGSPTALMELAYRLAVDDHEYIKSIRNNLITLITPVIEVDGRDKMVDVYKWHLAHPGQNYPGLVYWGKYVAHDNNRDAMGVDARSSPRTCSTPTCSGTRRCCTTCTSRCRISTTTPSATARTTPGSIRSSPTSGR